MAFTPYSGADFDNQLKILLVGDAGVGKSRSLRCLSPDICVLFCKLCELH